MPRLLRLACVTALLLAACKKTAPEAPPQPGAAPATIEVLKDGRWLFTYAEPKGTFTTTDKPDSVPETARALVRVFDPRRPKKTPGGGRVYVTNLNDVLSKGRAPARPMSREAFETAALAAHPTGESSPLAAQTMRPGADTRRGRWRRAGAGLPDGRRAARGHDLRHVVVRRLQGRAPVLRQPQDSVRRQGRRTRRRRGP
jgi:hypothetical protein